MATSVEWDGPKVGLHLAMVDCTVCLIDGEGRMIGEVTSITELPADEETAGSIDIYIEQPAA